MSRVVSILDFSPRAYDNNDGDSGGAGGDCTDNTLTFVAPRSLETILRGISVQYSLSISESINIPVVNRLMRNGGRAMVKKSTHPEFSNMFNCYSTRRQHTPKSRLCNYRKALVHSQF